MKRSAMRTLRWAKLLFVFCLAWQGLSTPAIPETGPRILVLGVAPWRGRTETSKAFDPFAAYLSEQLRRPVTLYVAKSYADLADKMEQGMIHIGFFPPTLYIQTSDHLPLMRYLATAIHEHGAYHKGYVVAHKDSGIESLRDFAGRSIAFPDRNSSSGYRIPMLLFEEAGVNPHNSFFGNTLFVGSHPAALRAVLDQRALGAATCNYIFNTFPQNDKLRIIAETPEIPGEAVVVHQTVPGAVQDAIEQILLHMDANTTNETGGRVMEHMPYLGFDKKEDAFYDPLRALLNFVPSS